MDALSQLQIGKATLKTAKFLTLLLIFMLAACSDSDDSNASPDDASDASIHEDAHSNDDIRGDADVSPWDVEGADAADVEADIDAVADVDTDDDIEETPPLATCSTEESSSNIPNNLAGFDSPGEVACAEFADAPLNHGSIISVESTRLVVELDDESSLELKDWQGPALDGIFAVGEAVDIAVPCSYSWSAVRGESGAVASLFETPFQNWPVQFMQLEELPAFLGAPSFALRPYCQRDSRIYNSLQVTLGDGTKNITTPSSTQIGDWTVEFGGSRWCCEETGGGGFEAPDTRSEVFLYRVD